MCAAALADVYGAALDTVYVIYKLVLEDVVTGRTAQKPRAPVFGKVHTAKRADLFLHRGLVQKSRRDAVLHTQFERAEHFVGAVFAQVDFKILSAHNLNVVDIRLPLFTVLTEHPLHLSIFRHFNYNTFYTVLKAFMYNIHKIFAATARKMWV